MLNLYHKILKHHQEIHNKNPETLEDVLKKPIRSSLNGQARILKKPLQEAPFSKKHIIPAEIIEDIIYKSEKQITYPWVKTEKITHLRELLKLPESQLKQAAITQTIQTLLQEENKFNNTKRAEVILKEEKYDVSKIKRNKDMLTEEFAQKEQNEHYYVPIIEFFNNNPMAQTFADLHFDKQEKLRKLQNSWWHKLLEEQGTKAQKLLGILALPLSIITGIGMQLTNKVKSDLNKFGGSEFLEAMSNYNVIAKVNYRGFYATHIFKDWTTNELSEEQAEQEGLTLQLKDIRRRKNRNENKIRIEPGSNKFRDLYHKLQVINFIRKEESSLVTLEPADWRLHLDPQPLTVTGSFNEGQLGKLMNINEESSDVVKAHKIRESIKRRFTYKKPKKIEGLSRFESAGESLEGVCQDANFHLWYHLRKHNIPSYFASGFAVDSDEIKLSDGHALCYFYNNENERWEQLDATPEDTRLEDKLNNIKEMIGVGLKAGEIIGKTIAIGAAPLVYVAEQIRDAKEKYDDWKIKKQRKKYADEISTYKQGMKRFNSLDKKIKTQLETLDAKELIYEQNEAASKIKSTSSFYFNEIDEEIIDEEEIINIKKLKETNKQVEYYNAASSIFLKLFETKGAPENIVNETAQAQGSLFPYENNSPEWNGIIKAILFEFGPGSVPPHPNETESPSRITANKVKCRSGYFEGKEYITKPPKHYPKSLHIEDQRLYRHRKGMDTEEARKLFTEKFGPKMYWYNLELEFKEGLSPQDKYMKSPQVLNYLDEQETYYEKEWLKLSNHIQDFIEAKEYPLPHLYANLLKNFGSKLAVATNKTSLNEPFDAIEREMNADTRIDREPPLGTINGIIY